MARIQIISEVDTPNPPTAELDEADEDGLHAWHCDRGHISERRFNPADAIADAEVHVDYQCR